MLACLYKHNIIALCQNLYIYPKNMLTFEMKLSSNLRATKLQLY